jgi:hypothetical protein
MKSGPVSQLRRAPKDQSITIGEPRFGKSAIANNTPIAKALSRVIDIDRPSSPTEDDIMSTSTNWPEWLSRREASAYLREQHGIKLGEAALANYAVDGGGPPYHKDGGRRVAYRRDDLDAWAPKRMRRVTSTSELNKRAALAQQHSGS